MTRTVHVVSHHLDELSVSSVELTPAFEPERQNYTADVPENQKTVTITAMAEDPTATVTIGGVAKGHGSDSHDHWAASAIAAVQAFFLSSHPEGPRPMRNHFRTHPYLFFLLGRLLSKRSGLVRVFTRLFLLIMLLSSVHIASAEVREIPPYAKWGRFAMQETKKRYPLADIVDYQHLGRDVVSSNRATETFKLWLRQDRREWAVRVIITFDTKTERAVSIQFREEPPPSQASFVLSQRFTPVQMMAALKTASQSSVRLLDKSL